ncbi:methyltransferase domain-containing protein [Mucilaginibacter corticis]|uniref:Methyltransferase domain-containing protein n=1 Tax=Mucilaginibacter corticis TaxID=2597670 RepID=A0A556MKQ9_9SPHI|nr:class I SAM-dependent methyltransferase [Mucilaginibacter corticis]TSJ40490.1 methyltransferase domain-containing protein [Mucilaginibacter corticis]
MNAESQQIRDQQKDSWNKFSAGWKKWDELTMRFLKPFGDEMISQIKPKDGETILDIATGTGEPGLSIAAMIPNGKVVLTDLAEEMLKITAENAVNGGLKNIETFVCDVSALPFADNTFDAVTCRMGFMFFPEMDLAAKEIMRVLKPGGRVATSVWNAPEKNFWVTAMMSTINKNMQLPVPPAGAPGMFRCAQPGLIADLLSNAGAKNILEKEMDEKLLIGTADVYWSFHTEVGAPIVAALGKADNELKAKIKEEVFNTLHQRYTPDNVFLDYSARIIYAEK